MNERIQAKAMQFFKAFLCFIFLFPLYFVYLSYILLLLGSVVQVSGSDEETIVSINSE